MQRLIAVFGAGNPSREEYNLAAEVGRLLAQRGLAVVCGGTYGIMEAACMGAREAGGLTVGLLPGYQRADANPYVDIVLPTGLGDARNVLVATAGEAAIAVGGRLGTLSEIALALKHGIPVVGLHTWNLDPAALFDRRVPAARTALEAVELALSLAAEREVQRRSGAGVLPEGEGEGPRGG
ncbi:MAG: TIGR00725 family protein [Planctomycetia bacterium]